MRKIKKGLASINGKRSVWLLDGERQSREQGMPADQLEGSRSSGGKRQELEWVELTGLGDRLQMRAREESRLSLAWAAGRMQVALRKGGTLEESYFHPHYLPSCLASLRRIIFNKEMHPCSYSLQGDTDLPVRNINQGQHREVCALMTFWGSSLKSAFSVLNALINMAVTHISKKTVAVWEHR